MYKSQSDRSFVLTIALGLVVLIGAIIGIHTYRDNAIQKWVTEHGYTVVSNESVGPFSNDSPWWRRKDDGLRRVVVTDGRIQRTAFFRWGFWGIEQAWKGDEKK